MKTIKEKILIAALLRHIAHLQSFERDPMILKAYDYSTWNFIRIYTAKVGKI